jgi:hypothetical protein
MSAKLPGHIAHRYWPGTKDPFCDAADPDAPVEAVFYDQAHGIICQDCLFEYLRDQIERNGGVMPREPVP